MRGVEFVVFVVRVVMDLFVVNLILQAICHEDRQTPGLNTEGFIIIFQTLSSTMCWHFYSNLNIALRDEEFTHHLVSILEIPRISTTTVPGH